jgi:hypothetical protein
MPLLAPRFRLLQKTLQRLGLGVGEPACFLGNLWIEKLAYLVTIFVIIIYMTYFDDSMLELIAFIVPKLKHKIVEKSMSSNSRPSFQAYKELESTRF